MQFRVVISSGVDYVLERISMGDSVQQADTTYEVLDIVLV